MLTVSTARCARHGRRFDCARRGSLGSRLVVLALLAPAIAAARPVLTFDIGAGALATGLASDGHALYVATFRPGQEDFGRILRVGPGALVVITTSKNQAPGPLILDGDRVAWLEGNGGRVCVADKSGGRACEAIASEQPTPVALVADKDFYYWSTSAADHAAGRVMRARKSGGAPEVVAAGQNASSLAVDDTRVYWVDRPGGKVMAAPRQGGTPTVLANEQANPQELVLSAGVLYWTLFGTDRRDRVGAKGAVMSLPVGGGAPAVLARLDQPASGLFVDDRFVYFTALNRTNVYSSGARSTKAATDGAVMKVGRGGGKIITLAARQDDPKELAVDGTSVYWTGLTRDGVVMRTAK